MSGKNCQRKQFRQQSDRELAWRVYEERKKKRNKEEAEEEEEEEEEVASNVGEERLRDLTRCACFFQA